MFFVFNKDKITAYVVTLFTVVVLFLTASVFEKKEEAIKTSVNEIKINMVKNNIDENSIVENNEILIQN